MTKKYIKRLKKYPKSFQLMFIDTISKIEIGDFSNLDVIELHGIKNMYRCRIWKFCILFHKNNIWEYIIDDIGSRGDIYK